jgi:hypothetical protein
MRTIDGRGQVREGFLALQKQDGARFLLFVRPNNSAIFIEP